MPYFIGAVLLLSFVLLMAVFRSVLVAMKAMIMNLLSLGAAFGLIVSSCSSGASAIASSASVVPGPIEAWGPMFIFAIVFGLSMDYEVFLLSRIERSTTATATTTARGGQMVWHQPRE
jgi:putative drug exporter of the RND superfamily